MEESDRELLVKGAAGLGVVLGEREVELLGCYLGLLGKWSREFSAQTLLGFLRAARQACQAESDVQDWLARLRRLVASTAA